MSLELNSRPSGRPQCICCWDYIFILACNWRLMSKHFTINSNIVTQMHILLLLIAVFSYSKKCKSITKYIHLDQFPRLKHYNLLQTYTCMSTK